MTEPKAIKDMSAAEYGALALAERRGETLEYLSYFTNRWITAQLRLSQYVDNMHLRIKPPEPVLGSVTLYGKEYSNIGWSLMSYNCCKDTHTLTIPTRDGEPITGTFRDEDGHEIVVGKIVKRTGE